MLSLKDFELLISLARHKHFARAAADCGISQPAFSMRINKMEDRLGTNIVRRGNRFQGFTAEGDLIVRHARKILDDVKVLDQEFRTAQGELSGALRLGVIPTAAAFAGRLAMDLRKAYPGITVRIETASSLAIQQGIEDGRFDAGLTYTEGASRDLMRVEPVYEETYVLLVPELLAPRQKGEVGWAEIAELPLSLLEPSMQNRRILDRVFAEAGVRPKVVAETSGFTAAMVMAAEGFTATVVPKVLIEALGGFDGTVVLPLVNPELSMSVGLVSSHRDRGIPAVNALRHLFKLS